MTKKRGYELCYIRLDQITSELFGSKSKYSITDQDNDRFKKFVLFIMDKEPQYANAN